MSENSNGVSQPLEVGQTRVLGPNEWPFHTQDAILAFCLYMAGAEFFDEKNPCVCEYNLAILRNLAVQGLPIKGKPIEEAVDIAVARKKKGAVQYGFRRTEKLERLLKAYQRQVQEIDLGNGTAAELVIDLVNRLRGNAFPVDEFLARVHCVGCKMKVKFMDMWSNHVFIRIDNAGESKTDEEIVPGPKGPRKQVTVTSPGFKIYPRHASKKLRKEMGL